MVLIALNLVSFLSAIRYRIPFLKSFL